MSRFKLPTGINTPMTSRIALRVSQSALKAIRRGHPWLYADAITQQSRDGEAGDIAVVFDNKRKFVAVGLYDPTSPLRLRVLHHGKPAQIDDAWLTSKIAHSVAQRSLLDRDDNNACRLIHGENDGLPGLVADRYADHIVVKLDTPAWLPYLEPICAALVTAIPATTAIVLRLSRRTAEHSPVSVRDGQMLMGETPNRPIIFNENGLRFSADLIRGHKTGTFLDQRDNRARVRELSNGKTVLDLFSYSGGFSVYAAAGGASAVTSVDISDPALNAAKQNIALNRANSNVMNAQHTTICGDAFEVLEQFGRNNTKFDVVIVDPPSFAKRQSEIERAERAYKRLARAAVTVLNPTGTLVMASCSSRISASRFFKLVEVTAAAANRPIDVWQRTKHPIDHPIGFPEGAYLKCLFADVD